MPSYLNRSLLGASSAEDQRLSTSQMAREIEQTRAETARRDQEAELARLEAQNQAAPQGGLDWGSLTSSLLASWGGDEGARGEGRGTSGLPGASRMPAAQPATGSDSPLAPRPSPLTLDWGALTQSLAAAWGPAPEATPSPAAGPGMPAPNAPVVPVGQPRAGGGALAARPPAAGGTEVLGAIEEGNPQRYFETAGPYARQVERETGVPAALSLAISANETGYGQRRYMAGPNNYHGIQDTTGTGVPYRDWRPGPNGEKVFYEARQAQFENPLEGFRGFARFLTSNPRYGPALERYRQTGDVNQLAADVHKAGYAEDPAYTTKITSIMRGIPVSTGVGEVTDTRGVPLTQARPSAPVPAPAAGPAPAARAPAPAQPAAGGIRVVPNAQANSYWTSGGTHGELPAADIFAPKGSPIYAPVGGTIAPAVYPAGGNAATMRGDDGRHYYFAHGNVPFTGGRVEAGQPIGQVGDSGNARGTSPHLHYAIATDPAIFSSRNGSGDITGEAYWQTSDGQVHSTSDSHHHAAAPAGAQTGTPPMATPAQAPPRQGAPPPPRTVTERIAAPWSEAPVPAGVPYDARQYDEGPREAPVQLAPTPTSGPDLLAHGWNRLHSKVTEAFVSVNNRLPRPDEVDELAGLGYESSA